MTAVGCGAAVCVEGMCVCGRNAKPVCQAHLVLEQYSGRWAALLILHAMGQGLEHGVTQRGVGTEATTPGQRGLPGGTSTLSRQQEMRSANSSEKYSCDRGECVLAAVY